MSRGKTLLASSNCSLPKSWGEGKQYLLQRKVTTSLHSTVKQKNACSFLFSISLHQGEALEHLKRTSRWLRWWCRWTRAVDNIGEGNSQQHGDVDKASSHFVVSLVHQKKRNRTSTVFLDFSLPSKKLHRQGNHRHQAVLPALCSSQQLQSL